MVAYSDTNEVAMNVCFEKYKTLKNYPDYLFGNNGNIISLKRRSVKVKKQVPDHRGYLVLKITDSSGRKANKKSHRLLSEAFYGPCPDGWECCHVDGNKQNNNVENLRWGSKSSNYVDRVTHGTDNEKFTVGEIREIRSRLFKGEMVKDIAKIFNVCGATISQIKTGKTYSHIPGKIWKAGFSSVNIERFGKRTSTYYYKKKKSLPS